ncbi:MAG: hypothetical protein IIZ94_15430, partial [Prevotella sp.]|nr:hypothetical protein [Prevotella sp.]
HTSLQSFVWIFLQSRVEEAKNDLKYFRKHVILNKIMSFDKKYIALRSINDNFTSAKTMLYEPQNNAFFDEYDAFYLSFHRLIIEKQLIINQLTKHRYFSIFLTTSKTFSKNVWKLNQNYEIT